MVLNSKSVKLAAMRQNKGFSLIELLIVVAIILIIAAIAIPNLLRARIAANESSAVSAIRSINTAEFTYNTAYPTTGYAAALANLGGPVNNCIPAVATACIIDSVLSSASPGVGSKSGYVFLATGLVPIAGANSSFVSAGSPVTFNMSGVRNFCSTEDGVLRFNPGAAGSAPVNTVANCVAFTILQ
jgi:prepilin-type N-terminal cleavage/methylation domain-containing protein